MGLRGAMTVCRGMVKGAELPPNDLTGSGTYDQDGDLERDHFTREGTEVIRPSTLHPGEFADTPSGNARLAIGVGYLLAGHAVLNFPTTNRAAPSRYVQVSLNSREPLREQDRGQFPMLVAWDIWENAIVPVLQDDANQVSQPWLASLLQLGQFLKFFQYIHGRLITSFQEQGLIP
jgi:hypothetical protein